MDEIIPGLRVWTTVRETIHQPVQSAYVVEARTLIDPMVPADGLDVFGASGDLPAPERILLTNRHHRRHSARFVEAFGCEVAASEPGLADLADAPFGVRGFRDGEEVAPGIVAHEVGSLCPDEYALHIAIGSGALAVADGVMREGDGALGSFPDDLLGDDPGEVKRGLAAAYRRLCDELDFDVLLMAHGEPLVGGAKDALRAYAERIERG